MGDRKRGMERLITFGPEKGALKSNRYGPT
jgi:hypothetical protein